MIAIDGKSLTLEQVIAAARQGEQVELTEESKKAINKTRAYVDKKLAEKA